MNNSTKKQRGGARAGSGRKREPVRRIVKRVPETHLHLIDRLEDIEECYKHFKELAKQNNSPRYDQLKKFIESLEPLMEK